MNTVCLDIIIVSRDRRESLLKCLEHLSQGVTYINNIIIVDSSENGYFNVNDCPYEVLRQKLNIINLQLDMGSQPIARNIALSKSDAEYVLFLDDDAYVSPKSLAYLHFLIENNLDKKAFGVNIMQGTALSQNDKEYILPSFHPLKWSVGNFNIIEKVELKVEHLQGTFMCFNRLCLLGLGGFNENLAGGYASFEETEVFMRLNKCFNDPILFSSHNSIQHGEVPRLFASRSLLSSRYYCFTYAKNGQTCSKAKYGAILSCVFLPLVMLVNYYRIFSSKDKASFYERVILVICFTFGALRGVLN